MSIFYENPTLERRCRLFCKALQGARVGRAVATAHFLEQDARTTHQTGEGYRYANYEPFFWEVRAIPGAHGTANALQWIFEEVTDAIYESMNNECEGHTILMVSLHADGRVVADEMWWDQQRESWQVIHLTNERVPGV